MRWPEPGLIGQAATGSLALCKKLHGGTSQKHEMSPDHWKCKIHLTEKILFGMKESACQVQLSCWRSQDHVEQRG